MTTKKGMGVAWDYVEAPKSLGGIGFINIKILNLDLLTKWWWKLSCDSNFLWKIVIVRLKGMTSQFFSID